MFNNSLGLIDKSLAVIVPFDKQSIQLKRISKGRSVAVDRLGMNHVAMCFRTAGPNDRAFARIECSLVHQPADRLYG